METLTPLDFKSLQTGLITESAVSEHKMPLDAVTESLNLHFDKIGSATVRPGLTQLGTTGSGNILGLYEFRDSGAGTNNQILMVNGTACYYLSGGTWTSKRTSLTAGSKARFSTYLDFVFMVNGTEATTIWDGNTSNSFLTTGNADSAPTGQFIENFRSRMWISGNSSFPDRVYFSSIPTAAATPVITWDTDNATGDWINVSPSDGENITGLKRSKTYLLVFKNNHIYRIASVSNSEPDPVINVGTYSNESIVDTKNGTYFHHPTGIFRYADGVVQEVSKPIQDIIDNISASNYEDICGWEDGDHVYWSVGDVTIKGITYTNLVVRYTISSQAWTHYTYPTKFLFASPYDDGTKINYLVGDNAGKIYKTNTGNDDAGTQIQYNLIHRWYNIDGLISTRKNIQGIAFSHSGGNGTNVSYQTEESAKSEWTPIGQLGTIDTGFSAANIKGRKMRIRISGSSKGETFSYHGFEIPKPQTDYVQFKQ
jgi:hypothetical protein